MLDILIRQGRLVDGLGGQARVADIGIESGKVVAVDAQLGDPARTVIDANGLLVGPGFIDVHSHDDLAVLHDPEFAHKLFQGVTTTIVGNCGLGPTPVGRGQEARQALQQYVEPVLGKWPIKDGSFGFESFEDYVREVEGSRHSLNVGALIAHGSLRIQAMGFSDAPAGVAELAQMEATLSRAMEAGALGMSLGLMYAPGCFATFEELVHLAKVVGKHGGLVASHIRGEGDLLLASIDEMLELAKAAEVPVHISHLKAVGIHNWGSIQKALTKIEDARRRGLDITCDVYPYAAGSTTITSLLPPWVLQGGIDAALGRLEDVETRQKIAREISEPATTWDNVALLTGFNRIVLAAAGTEAQKPYEGRTFADIAEELSCSDIVGYLQMVVEGRGLGTIIVHHMNEEDVRAVLKFQHSVIGSDGLPTMSGYVHPRLYGTFPRVLGHYAREEKLFQMETAMMKMSSQSAERFKLAGRGRLAPGHIADIVVVDADKVVDRASYTSPRMLAEGITTVIVAGQVVLHEGNLTQTFPGTFIKRHL